MKQPIKRDFYVLGRDIIPYKRKDMHDLNSTKVCLSSDIKSAIGFLITQMCRCKTMVGKGKKCYACRNIARAFPILIRDNHQLSTRGRK